MVKEVSEVMQGFSRLCYGGQKPFARSKAIIDLRFAPSEAVSGAVQYNCTHMQSVGMGCVPASGLKAVRGRMLSKLVCQTTHR